MSKNPPRDRKTTKQLPPRYRTSGKRLANSIRLGDACGHTFGSHLGGRRDEGVFDNACVYSDSGYRGISLVNQIHERTPFFLDDVEACLLYEHSMTWLSRIDPRRLQLSYCPYFWLKFLQISYMQVIYLGVVRCRTFRRSAVPCFQVV